MKIHILAIVGKMTTPLAVELKRLGHDVSGSDQEKIYPPASTILEESKISVNSTTINKSIDLVIVGSAYSHFQSCIAELEQVKSLKIPYITATEYIAQFIVKDNSIVVAGAYGKTTITAFLSYLLTRLNLDPSFAFGEKAVGDLPSLHTSNSNWSVIEGDESINGLDTRAKFFSYKPKYLILTSANWEHKESYPTKESSMQAFTDLVKMVPSDGLIVYNPHDLDIQHIINNASAKTIPYQSFDVNTPLIGQHNHQNICAALTLINALQMDINTAISATSSFLGVARRLEVLSNKHNITIIDDYAQSPSRVNTAIKSIREAYPLGNIKVFFEPHASFLQNTSSLSGFGEAFSPATEVVLSQISYYKSTKDSRVTARSFREEIGDKLAYIPLYEDILNHFIKTLTPGDILVHFSSGGLLGLNTLETLVSHIDSQLSYT